MALNRRDGAYEKVHWTPRRVLCPLTILSMRNAGNVAESREG